MPPVIDLTQSPENAVGASSSAATTNNLNTRTATRSSRLRDNSAASTSANLNNSSSSSSRQIARMPRSASNSNNNPANPSTSRPARLTTDALRSHNGDPGPSNNNPRDGGNGVHQRGRVAIVSDSEEDDEIQFMGQNARINNRNALPRPQHVPGEYGQR